MWQVYHPVLGPVLEVVIDTLPVARELSQAPEFGPPSPARRGLALLDTGASHSCIDRTIALDLRLPDIGVRTYSGITSHNHARQVTSCRAALLVFPALEQEVHLEVMCIDPFSRVDAGRLQPMLLLGRDFLAQYDITFQGKLGRFLIRPAGA
jgi:hypothetical protein